MCHPGFSKVGPMEWTETRILGRNFAKICVPGAENKAKMGENWAWNVMFFQKNKTKLGTEEIAIYNPQNMSLGLTKLDFEISSLWLNCT